MKYLTAAEVAETLRETPWATRRRLVKGEISGIKSGRQWLIEEAALQAYLTKKTHVPVVDPRRKRRSA